MFNCGIGMVVVVAPRRGRCGRRDAARAGRDGARDRPHRRARRRRQRHGRLTPAMPPAAQPACPASIWALGFVSLLMDISSEMIHSLLPVFLVTALGASTLAVGLIEGVGRSHRADRQGVLRRAQRLARPAQAAGGARLRARRAVQAAVRARDHAPAWCWRARLIDRVGKGMRGAPRDALVADLAPPEHARRRLRPAPVARHGRRLPRAAARDRR